MGINVSSFVIFSYTQNFDDKILEQCCVERSPKNEFEKKSLHWHLLAQYLKNVEKSIRCR